MEKECPGKKMEHVLEIIDETVAEKFVEGNIVFIIYEGDKIKGMVNTKEDYEKKIQTHIFNPLLNISILPLKIAYLYDCLHRNFSSKKIEKTIVVKWRVIGSSEWNDWFRVLPYADSLY